MSHFTALVSLKNEGQGNGGIDYLESWAESQIWDLLEPYCVNTDKIYMVFDDMTEDVAEGYTPKMQKKYPTMREFAEKFCFFSFDEEKQAYGSWCNENAFFDWHQIGGRWAEFFLVKENCQSAVHGERDLIDAEDMQKAPCGYKWVAGAKKSDIAWDLMKSYGIEVATRDFAVLETAFCNKILPKEYVHCQMSDNGIFACDDLVYAKGDTLKIYLERNGFGADSKYPIVVQSCLKSDEYISRSDITWFGGSLNESPIEEWLLTTQAFIESIDNDDFIVVVDCHI
jgi:hypothetical protein